MAEANPRATAGVTAPLLVQLQARAAARPETATSQGFGSLVDEARKHDAIDAELVAMGLQPLTAEQVECLNDPVLADEAADMLDDLQARLGVSAAACDAALDAQAIQADLAYNVDKAGRAHRENDARALRLQMRYPTVDGK